MEKRDLKAQMAQPDQEEFWVQKEKMVTKDQKVLKVLMAYEDPQDLKENKVKKVTQENKAQLGLLEVLG